MNNSKFRVPGGGIAMVLALSTVVTPLAAQQPESTPGGTEETITVVTTANLFPEAISSTPATITRVDEAQIIARQAYDLTDVMRLAPSLSLLQTGTRGKTATLQLRGANTNQTLILMDGVRINPPSQGVVDFASIPLDNIDHIEILRGPQSTLYGSDAMGGVINIVTRRGQGKLSSGALLEYGSRNTNREMYSLRGTTGKGTLSLSASRAQSDGSFPNDDFRNLGFSLRYDHPAGATSEWSFITGYADAITGTPGQRVVLYDPNERTKSQNWNGSLQWQHQRDGRQDKVAVGWLTNRLTDNDPNDPGDPFYGTTEISDRMLNLQVQSSRVLGRHTVTAGGELRRDQTSFAVNSNGMFGPFTNALSSGVSTHALFVQDKLELGKLVVIPGLRYEKHSNFPTNWSGRLSSSYAVSTRGRVKANVGTGFHAPTIQQLFDPLFGNPALRPEKSTGYELGYAHDLGPASHVEVTGFVNRFRSLIGNDPVTFASANVNRARTTGLELAVDHSFSNDWRLVLNQSVLHVSASNPNFVLRRPRFSTAVDLIHDQGKWQFDLGLIASGKRMDNDFAGPFSGGSGTGLTSMYPGFSRVDFSISRILRPGLQAFVRAQNLFNRQYQQVAGYPAPGFNVVVGIRASQF